MSRKRPKLAESLIRSRESTFACKRCRSRKVRCDDGFPRCDGCKKAGMPCIVADDSTAQDFTRAEVQSLEDELLRLEALLVSNADPVNGTPSQGSDDRSRRTSRSPCTPVLERDSRLIQPSTDTSREQRLISPQHQHPSINLDKPHALPSREYASEAVAEYFREFHVRHPILDQAEMDLILERVYNDTESIYGPEGPRSRQQKHDLFQLNMALAIGSIYIVRNNSESFHPFGFFTAALEINPPSEFCFNDISDVENLLLITLFGLFYNIGCSLWELGRLCVRICIELQFHQQQITPVRSYSTAQRCRRIFWESYLLDRFSSSILGRPFAIDDEDIHIDVPSNSGSNISSHLLRIGRITSKMHISMYHSSFQTQDFQTDSGFDASSDLKGIPNSTNAIFLLRKFHSQLQSWKLEAPTFDTPTCVYETADFIEMTFQESRLWLFRAVINELPAGPSRIRHRLSLLCYQAAQRILTCFNNIQGNNLVSCNRSSMRLILVCGLIIISTIKTQPPNIPRQEEGQSYSDLDIDTWLEDVSVDTVACFPSHATCYAALETCAMTLSWLSSQMPEVSAYAHLFERLKSEVGSLHPTSCGVETMPRFDQTLPADRAFSDSTTTMVAEETNRQHHQQALQGTTQQDEPTGGSGLSIQMQPTIPSVTLDDLLLDPMLNANSSMDNGGEVVGNNTFWSISDDPWMEQIDGNISGLIWDTSMPWQWSPFTNA